MQIQKSKDIYAFSRFMYILEAAFEYFISIVMGGVYLAKLGMAVGLSDATIGILNSFVSLGCGMQIVAVFIRGRVRTKRFVTIGNIINQSLFVLMYLTPFVPVPLAYRSVLLIAALLVGQFVLNVIHSHKINWFMSLIDDNKRGRFTANKEIISLLSGMAVSFALGSVCDYFEARNNQSGFFIVAAIALFVLMGLHTATLLLSKEKNEGKAEEEKQKIPLKEFLLNKNLLKVIGFSILWHIIVYIAPPFYASYLIGPLGMSMTLIATLGAMGSIVRATASRPMGSFADKRSFANALILCFTLLGIGYVLNTFAAPGIGTYLYAGYVFLHGIAYSGINSGTINLVYDYVPHSHRVAAFALQNSIAGVAGFLTTLAVSPLVDYIQKNGNVFLGIHVYPQQLLSFFGALGTVVVLLYLFLVIRPMRRVKEMQESSEEEN